jgi:hypothetical protein
MLGGDNIFFGHSDTNATSSTDVNDVHLLFTLIDNIQVTQNGTSIPAPPTLVLLGVALVAARLNYRRKQRACA